MFEIVREVVTNIQRSALKSIGEGVIAASTTLAVVEATKALAAAEFMLNQSVTIESVRQIELNLRRAIPHLKRAGFNDYAQVIERQANTVRKFLNS